MSDGGNVYVGNDRRLSNQDDVEVVNCSCGYNFPDGLMIQVVIRNIVNSMSRINYSVD